MSTFAARDFRSARDTATPRRWPTRPALLCIAVGLAVSAPLVLTRAPATAPDLALLLRFMAGVKAVVALAVIGAIAWRLRRPADTRSTGAYVAAAALTAAGPACIWTLAYVAVGAALFYAGLVGTAAVAWRDAAAWNAMLAALVARRRGTSEAVNPAPDRTAPRRSPSRPVSREYARD